MGAYGGGPAGQGELQPGRDLAINPGHVTTPVPGIATKDPSFGLDALWIERGLREQAQMAGYTVVDPATVVATHLSQVLMRSTHELLGHEEVQQLLDRLAAQAPKLVENLTPKVLPLGTVLCNLLQEGVPVRDLRSTAESLAEHGARSQDPDVLTALVRVAIGRGILQEIFGMAPELALMPFQPELVRSLLNAVQGGDGALGLEPGLAERLRDLLADAAQRQELLGQPAALVAPNALRLWLARFVQPPGGRPQGAGLRGAARQPPGAGCCKHRRALSRACPDTETRACRSSATAPPTCAGHCTWCARHRARRPSSCPVAACRTASR